MLGAIIAGPFATPLTRDFRATHLATGSGQLGEGVGCHNGGCRGAERWPLRRVDRQCWEFPPPAFRGEKASDHAGRADKHVVSRASELAGDFGRHPAGVVIASFARARVGVPRIDDYGAGRAPRDADREIFTGAPQTRFVVNTPTAVEGRSAAKSARSSFAGSALMPQATPAARKPAGSGNRLRSLFGRRESVGRQGGRAPQCGPGK